VSNLSAETSVEDDTPLVAIAPKTLWVNRRNGQIYQVLEVDQRPGNTVIIGLKAFSDDADARTVRMVRADFLRYHRPYDTVVDVPSTYQNPPVLLTVDEEWESVNGDVVTIVHVDTRTDMVTGLLQDSKQRRPIKMAEFNSGKWRKIVRKTAFDRLNSDDGEDLF